MEKLFWKVLNNMPNFLGEEVIKKGEVLAHSGMVNFHHSLFEHTADAPTLKVIRDPHSRTLKVQAIVQVTDEMLDNAEDENTKAIDAMTVAQLKEYAAEHKIDLGDATTKANIRAAIDANVKIVPEQTGEQEGEDE